MTDDHRSICLGLETLSRASYPRDRDSVTLVRLEPKAGGPLAQGRHPKSLSTPSLSPCTDDKLEQQHSLFTRYKDPCRLGPGEEKPWAIGELGRRGVGGVGD